jgi:hypothetical protein
MTDDKWMSIDEAVERVMKVEKCSRQEARKKVAEAAKAKKLHYKKVPIEIPMGEPLPPEEAVRRLEEDPSSVFIPLSEFVHRHGFTPKELIGELSSGRLRSRASEVTLFKMQVGEPVNPAEVSIDMQALINWITNPKTPPHLVEKFNDGLEPKLQ